MASNICSSLYDELFNRGIVNQDFTNTLKAMGVKPSDINKDFDGFLLSLKNHAIESSRITRAQYLSNANANKMFDRGAFYFESKGGDVSRPTVNQWLSTEYSLTRKATNEQKSILWGNNMLGKEWTDINGNTQMFAPYIEQNNLHRSVLDTLMNNKNPDGFDKEAANILNNFRTHLNTEAGSLVGTKELNVSDMVKTDYIYKTLDEAKLKFYDANQTTKAKRSVLKFLRGDNHIEIDPKRKPEFFKFLNEEFGDILDYSKNSPEQINKFFDNYYFAQGGRSNLEGMLDKNIFDNMDKTRLFGETFTPEFVGNPLSFGKYEINAADVMDSVVSRWSRNYGVYSQLGARPFETLKSFLDKSKGALDSTTYSNLNTLVKRRYVGGLVEELKLSSSATRNAGLDFVNTLGNLVLAPRLLAFALVNVDDLPMRNIMTSAMTGDSALTRSFLDGKTTLQRYAKDFILGTITGKDTFEKGMLNSIAGQQEANLAKVLTGTSLEGMPRYTNRWQKGLATVKDAYNSGGFSKAATSLTGSNIATAGNESLEKAMVFGSNDIANEVLTKIKSDSFDPKAAFLTSDAIKRNGITDKMLDVYKKSDKITNFADDLSTVDVLDTMKISKDNMNTRALETAVQGEVNRQLETGGLLNKGGKLTEYQRDRISTKVMDFYVKTKGQNNVPDTIMSLLNEADKFDFISNGGELTIRTKPEYKSSFNLTREKEFEKNFNSAYRQLLEIEGRNVRSTVEKQIYADIKAGNKNSIVDNYNKKIDQAIRLEQQPKPQKTTGKMRADLETSNPELLEILDRNIQSKSNLDVNMQEAVLNQRAYLDESFENLQYTLFEDHFGLFSSSYDTANVINDLAQLDPKLAIMYRVNTFYKATLGRSINRANKLMNAKLGDGESLNAQALWNNKQMLLNKQVGDMFVAAVVGNQVVNSFKSDLQGNDDFMTSMSDLKKWRESLLSAPYIATPFGYNYTTTLATASTALPSYAKNKFIGEDYFAEQDLEKFRKAIFSGTGYNIVDNWILSNFMEVTRPNPELGDPLTEIYANVSKRYRKESGYQKLANKEKRKNQNEKKKKGGK